MNYLNSKHKWPILTLILVIAIPNFFTSALVELSYDEAYYWIYSEFLSWGYYDHPPMIALWIRLGTSLFGQNEFAVRSLPNLFLILSLVLLWKMLGEKKNLIVFSLLFLSMPLVNFSGVFSLPDSALMLTSVFYFWSVKKYLLKDNSKTAFFVALSIVAMFYSKYHGLLIVLLSLIAYPKFFKRKTFYLIVGLVILLYAPHIYWQYKHEWVTFKFHLFGRREKHFSLANITNYLSGQIMLMGFANFFLFVYIYYKERAKDAFERILVFNSFGFLVFLLFVSLRNQIEANWTITCSISFLLLMTPRLFDKKKVVVLCSVFSIILVIIMRGALFSAEKLSVYEYDYENRFNELAGWKSWRIPLIRKICGDLKVVADNYQYASKVGFYLGRPLPALHLGSRNSHFGLINLEQAIAPDEPICYLTTKKLKNTIKIDTYFKDPIYILTPTSLNFLVKRYNTTYEEIIRN